MTITRLQACVLPAAFFAFSVAATPLELHQTAFKPSANGYPAGWNVWSARAEIAPKAFVDATQYRTESRITRDFRQQQSGRIWRLGVLALGSYGRQVVSFCGLLPCRGACRMKLCKWSHASTGGPRRTIPPAGPTIHTPLLPTASGHALRWTHSSPEKAAAVKIELYLDNAPQATLWWDDISLEEIADPGPRRVTIATVKFHPQHTHSAEENVQQFVDWLTQKCRRRPTSFCCRKA